MCDCGLMRKIVKKTAQGTYSCFSLDPEKYNELLSSPEEKQTPRQSGNPIPKTFSSFSDTTPTVLKSTVGSSEESSEEASALKSTVACSPKCMENAPTVLKSTVATVLKSTVLLKNSSTNLNPLTKIPAAAIRTTLFELDQTLILDADFYQAAADFLQVHSLGEDYLRWFYQHLKRSKHITNLPGYFFKVFFKTVYVERYKAQEKKREENPKNRPKEFAYTCPVCGTTASRTEAATPCVCCSATVDPSASEIVRYKSLFLLDEKTKERYLFARLQALRTGGNVSEKLHALDIQYGVVN